MALAKLQGSDFKSEADLIAQGATASSLLPDTKIYISALSLNKTLDDAITDGDIGGSGGAGSIQWIESGATAFPEIENSMQVYKFVAGDAQDLYCLLKVPASYQAGKQVKMLVAWYSPETSGTGLIRAQSTLIKSGTDAVSSTTNQRTTTNTAVTLSGSTVNKPQAVVLDLSSTIGQINAVAIAAGDFIKIRLFRDTDTALQDIRVLALASEVTFNG